MDEMTMARFHVLRQMALHGTPLTDEETAELAGYMATLESEESEALRPAREEQEAQIIELRQRIADMRQLVARREVIATRLRGAYPSSVARAAIRRS